MKSSNRGKKEMQLGKFNLFCLFLNSILFLPIMASCVNVKTCSSQEIPSWLSPDSVVLGKLGNSLTAVLFMPDSVKCHALIHKDSIAADEQSPVKGYARDSVPTDFDAKQIVVLQYILLSNPLSYSVDSIKIEAPYLPAVEFEFSREGSSTASVIVSTSDQSWTVFYDGKKQFTYNYADSRIVERFCQNYMHKYFNTDKP